MERSNIMYRMLKREKILFYIVVFLVSCTILNKIVLRPAIDKSAALSRQIQLKRRMIENFLCLLNQKEEIQEESRKYANYAKEKLSNEEETAFFLKEIEGAARKSSVQLTDLKPYSTKKIDFYTEYKVEVETESDINQLINFIYNLQNSDNLLRVVKFRISQKINKMSMLRTYLTITKIFIL